MAKKLNISALILILFSINACTSVDKQVYVKDKENLKRNVRISVLSFVDAPGKEGSGIIVADTLSSEMIKISNWTIVERPQVEKVLKEKNLGMAGVTDADIGQIGSISNADYIIVGSVSEYHYERKYYIVPKTKLAFNARILETKTGSVVATVRYSRETNKNAWVGCCLLGWYYGIYVLMSDENINDDMTNAAKDVVREISKDVEKKRGCCLGVNR